MTAMLPQHALSQSSFTILSSDVLWPSARMILASPSGTDGVMMEARAGNHDFGCLPVFSPDALNSQIQSRY